MEETDEQINLSQSSTEYTCFALPLQRDPYILQTRGHLGCTSMILTPIQEKKWHNGGMKVEGEWNRPLF